MDDVKDYFEDMFGPDVCKIIFDIKRQLEFYEKSYNETKFVIDFNINYNKKTPTFHDIINNKELTYDEYIYRIIATKYNFHIQRKMISYTISDEGISITPNNTGERIKILSITYA